MNPHSEFDPDDNFDQAFSQSDVDEEAALTPWSGNCCC